MRQTNLQRLLWKEFREGWPVIGAFLLFPLLVFPFIRLFPHSLIVGAMAATVVFGVPFTAVLWASEKRRTVKQGRDLLSAVLPVSPVQDWVTLFLLPALAVGFCGGWMYLLYSATPPELMVKSSALNGALITVIAFMLSSFLSKSVSHILGIAMGTLWILCTFPMFTPIQEWIPRAAFIPPVLALAALGVNEFRKTGAKPLKAFAVCTLLVLAVSILHQQIVDVYGSLKSVVETVTSAVPYGSIWMRDASLDRKPNSPKPGIDTISYTSEWWVSRRIDGSSPMISRQFPSISVPISAEGDSKHIYVLSQQPGQSMVSINRWDPLSGQVVHLSDFLGTSRTLHSSTNLNSFMLGHLACWINPAGDRMLLTMQSAMGTGQDLWLINLTSRTRKLIKANSLPDWYKATWVKDRIYLTGGPNPEELSTLDYRIKPLMAEGKN